MNSVANYLFKSVQAFKQKGFTPYAISIQVNGSASFTIYSTHLDMTPEQNEPQSSNPTLPSAMYSTSAQAAVAVQLRSLLDSNGFNSVKVIGYEHNWDNAGSYASQLVSTLR